MDYKVLVAFERYAKDEVVKLNPRQAKYLLMSGHIRQEPAAKAAKAEK